MISEIAIDKAMHQPVTEHVEVLRWLRRIELLRCTIVRPVLDLTFGGQVIRYRENKVRLTGIPVIFAGKTRVSSGGARAYNWSLR